MKNDKNLLVEGLELLIRQDKDAASILTRNLNGIILKLEQYIKEIELFNKAYGLVSVKTGDELIVKHILDSLAPLGIIYRLLKNFCAFTGCNENALNIADAGSGAGLPGIPLAIVLGNINFTLIERMKRRAQFLWNTKASLGLANIAIEECGIEDVKNDSFPLITFRAFKPIDQKLLSVLLNKCKKNGIIAAYKGKKEKILQEMNIPENIVQWETIPCYVPFLDEERHLLIISTSKDTIH